MIKNVHGNTVEHLGLAIVSGQYPTGSSLPAEPALCEELGVSRTVVRESVKSLAAKGLIITGPKLGTRVLPEDHWNWFDPDVVSWQARSGLTPEFLRDLQDLRQVVEPAAVRLAAQRASVEDVDVIETAFAGMKRAVEQGGDYVTFDLGFHQGLLRASHNRMLMQMSKALSALLRTSFEISTTRKNGPAQSLPLHRAVLDAVVAQDPDRAEQSILKLIHGAHEDIEHVLGARKRLPRLSKPASLLKGG
jgi:DNA-binding FadR family transcriptional regulator